MELPLTGGCACGAIRYSCTGEPFYIGNCHCRDCQQATGSGYFAAVAIQAVDFAITQGEPKWFEKKSNEGTVMQRGFCTDCGSPLFLINGAMPEARVVYAGSLDEPSQYTPSRDIFVSSAQPWDIMSPDIPKDDKMPDW